MRTIASILILSLLALGCVSKEKHVIHDLENPAPVNCSTAEGDIRVLEGEKVHAAKQASTGATAVFPAGAALGILTGTEGTKMKIASGKYNKMIDDRIAQIRRECGL